MICSSIRGPLEGARHHGLRDTHRCREGRYQQLRGAQAGHDTSYDIQCPASIGELGLSHTEQIVLLEKVQNIPLVEQALLLAPAMPGQCTQGALYSYREAEKNLEQWNDPHSTEFRGEGPRPCAITLKLGRYSPMLGHQLHRPSALRMTHTKHGPPDPRKPHHHC